MSSKCAVFIDGGYLDNMMHDVGVYRIDYSRFAEKLVNEAGLLRTYYYHCPPFIPEYPTPEDSERMEGKQRFFTALSNLPRFEVRLGYVVPRGRNERGETIIQQKGVDVKLAVDVVRLSYMRSIACACLVAGDGDFLPMVQCVKDAGVVVKLFFGTGPNCTASEKLLEACDERTILQRSFFEGCRL